MLVRRKALLLLGCRAPRKAPATFSSSAWYSTGGDEMLYEEERQKQDIKSMQFYDNEAKDRRYFYYVDLLVRKSSLLKLIYWYRYYSTIHIKRFHCRGACTLKTPSPKALQPL